MVLDFISSGVPMAPIFTFDAVGADPVVLLNALVPLTPSPIDPSAAMVNLLLPNEQQPFTYNPAGVFVPDALTFGDWDGGIIPQGIAVPISSATLFGGLIKIRRASMAVDPAQGLTLNTPVDPFTFLGGAMAMDNGAQGTSPLLALTIAPVGGFTCLAGSVSMFVNQPPMFGASLGLWAQSTGLRLQGVTMCVLGDSSISFDYSGALPATTSRYVTLSASVDGLISDPASVGVTAHFNFTQGAGGGIKTFVEPKINTYAGSVKSWLNTATTTSIAQELTARSNYETIKAAAIAAYSTLASSIRDNENLARRLASNTAAETVDMDAEEEFIALLRIAEGGADQHLRALQGVPSTAATPSKVAAPSNVIKTSNAITASSSKRPSTAVSASRTSIPSPSGSRSRNAISQGAYLDLVLNALQLWRDWQAIVKGLNLLTTVTLNLNEPQPATVLFASASTRVELEAPPVFLYASYSVLGVQNSVDIFVAPPLDEVTTGNRFASAVKLWFTETYLTSDAAVSKYLNYIGGSLPAAY